MMLTQEFTQALRDWAQEDEGMEALIVVGSHARGANRPDSDLDLVVITTRKPMMVETQDFPARFGKVAKQQTEYYGACTSVRAWYEDGREIEFGIVEPSWMDIPLDAGTHKVLSDGYLVLTDKKGYFDGLEL